MLIHTITRVDISVSHLTEFLHSRLVQGGGEDPSVRHSQLTGFPVLMDKHTVPIHRVYAVCNEGNAHGEDLWVLLSRCE